MSRFTLTKILASTSLVSVVFAVSALANEKLPAVEYRGAGIPPCAGYVTLIDGHDHSSTPEIMLKSAVHGEMLLSTEGKFMKYDGRSYVELTDAEGTLVWVAGKLRGGSTNLDFNRIAEYMRTKQLVTFQQIVFGNGVNPNDYLAALESVLPIPSGEAETSGVNSVYETTGIHLHGTHYDRVRCPVRRVIKHDEVEFPEHEHDLH